MGRYSCRKGKIVTLSKANRFCLLKRCGHLLVQFRKGKYRQVVPITMLETQGC